MSHSGVECPGSEEIHLALESQAQVLALGCVDPMLCSDRWTPASAGGAASLLLAGCVAAACAVGTDIDVVMLLMHAQPYTDM